jgi:hypothetical protein
MPNTITMTGAEYDQFLADHYAEIKRLRAANVLDLQQAQVEIERLRETIAEWQEIHGTFTGDVHHACQAEIERLRGSVIAATKEGEHWYHLWADRGVEIERLRAALKRLADLADDDGSAP